MGIELKKEWVATLDNRTRHAHAMADGQVVAVDKPFKLDGYDLMFPGDKSAPGYLVYNCRCTTIAAFKDYGKDAKRRSIDGVGKDMTYQEWAEQKKAVASTAKDGIIKRENIVIGKSLGAARKSIEVLLPDGAVSKLTEDTEITDVEVFAGAGTNVPLRVKDFLVQNYGGRSELWQHVKGRGYVDTEGGSRKAMLHWFEEESVGIVEMKVKGWSKT